MLDVSIERDAPDEAVLVSVSYADRDQVRIRSFR